MLRHPNIVAQVLFVTLCFGVSALAEDTAGRAEASKLRHREPTFIYRQTGGFIGARRLYEQKLEDLSASERTKLNGLIKDSGLLKIDGEKRLTEGACDVFYYDFTLKDGKQTHHAVFDDTTLPDSYRPLVNYLKDKVKDEKSPPVQTNDTKQ